MNSVVQGDCLNYLVDMDDNSVNMIYLDPPFFTQKTQKLSNKENIEYSFEDKWDSMNDYIEYLKRRVKEMQRVLREDGLIFLHCDRSASHHLRVMLDDIFGANNFQSEIVWSYKRWSNAKKGLMNTHQTIFMYSKTKDFKFNTVYQDYSVTTNLDQILQERVRSDSNKTVYKLDSDGNPVIGKEKKGVPLGDVWEIPYLNPRAKERTGYPTQKPILLLEQILRISTDKGDLVLDPFAGSGTTLVASKLLSRNFIGIDQSEDACVLSRQRLENPKKTESALLNDGVDKYKTKTEEQLKILQSLNARVVQRNKAVDGFLPENFDGYPVPVRIQRINESLDDIVGIMMSNKKSKDSKIKIIVRTDDDNLLYDSYIPDDFLVIDSYSYKIDAFKNNIVQK